MLQIRGTDGMGMELDASEIDDPGKTRRIVNDNFLGRATGRKGKRYNSQPLWPLCRGTLLIEGRLLGTVHEALQDERPIPNSCQSAVRNRKVVLHELKLGNLDFPGEVRLARMRDADLTSGDLQRLVVFLATHTNRLAELPFGWNYGDVDGNRGQTHFCPVKCRIASVGYS